MVSVGDIMFLSANNKDLSLRSSMVGLYFCEQAHGLLGNLLSASLNSMSTRATRL